MFWKLVVGMVLLAAPNLISAPNPEALPSISKSVYDVAYPRDLTITGSAFLTSLVPYLFADSLIPPRCPCSVSEIPSFERSVVNNHSAGALVFSDVALTLALTGPVVGNYFYHGGFSDAFWEDAVIYAQTLSISSALVSLTKVIVQRPLPAAYAGDPQYVSSSRGYRAFYSGHASTTMAALASAAITLNLRKQGRVWPWVVAGGVGTAVALARVAGGVHFYSDIVVGLSVGTAVGILVPLLHKKQAEKGSDTSLMIIPQHQGALAVWTRRF